jgi:REP element-mobilizing transposase RayT
MNTNNNERAAESLTPSSVQHSMFHRKSPRATFHFYSGKDYFVTICTSHKQHFFGDISDGKMNYSKIGQYAADALGTLGRHYSYANVRTFVVMPNHVHAIISITDDDSLPRERGTLGNVIAGYKQSVTLFARRYGMDFCWQTRYHDHIIRDKNDGNKIAEYIENNVARWNRDVFCL